MKHDCSAAFIDFSLSNHSTFLKEVSLEFCGLLLLSMSPLYLFSGDNAFISIFSVDKLNEICSKMVACQNKVAIGFDVIAAGKVVRDSSAG